MNKNKFRRFFEDLIFHDFWRKLVALFLALLLYLAIAPRIGENREKTFHNVPVHIEIPPNLTLSNSDMCKVKLVLSGNVHTLENIDPGALNIRAEVHTEGIVPGEAYPLRLRPGNVSNLPRGIKVLSISPRDIPLELEPVISKPVPLKANFASSLSGDYAVDGVDFMPSKIITITGPAKLVNTVTAIYTNPILLDENVTQSFDYPCTISSLPGIRTDRSSVIAKVKIKKILINQERTIPVKIFRAEQYKISAPMPYNVNIKLKGTTSALALLSDNDIVASINLDGVDKPGRYTPEIKVYIAGSNPNIMIEDFSPRAAAVTIEAITPPASTSPASPAPTAH